MRFIIISLLFLFSVINSYASDQVREQKYAEQINEMLVVGEAIELEVEGQTFLALYTEPETDSKNAAIIMHGRDVHPNWADVVFPLRSSLPEYNWGTLSVQMPVSPPESSFDVSLAMLPEAPPRIDAAVAYLQQQGFDNIVLIAHSFGAQMGTYYLAHSDQPKVSAFISVGLAAAEVGIMKTTEFMEKINIPMLDLYGSEDFPNVVSTAWVRAGVQGDNNAYQQIKVEGADHFFSNHDTELVEQVMQWLQALK